MTCTGHGGRAPQYACPTFGVFVCTTCSGAFREFQFRVKSISNSLFSPEEVRVMQETGNDSARARYLAGWYGTQNERTCPLVENSKPGQLRDFIRQVFHERRFEGAAAPPPAPTPAAPAPVQAAAAPPPAPEADPFGLGGFASPKAADPGTSGGGDVGWAAFGSPPGSGGGAAQAAEAQPVDLFGMAPASQAPQPTQTAPAPVQTQGGQVDFQSLGPAPAAPAAPAAPVAAANNGEWDAFSGATPAAAPAPPAAAAPAPVAAPPHPRLLLPQPRRLLQRLRLREKCSMTTSSVLRRSRRNRRLARTVLEDPPRLRWAPSARANREFLLRG